MVATTDGSMEVRVTKGNSKGHSQPFLIGRRSYFSFLFFRLEKHTSPTHLSFSMCVVLFYNINLGISLFSLYVSVLESSSSVATTPCTESVVKYCIFLVYFCVMQCCKEPDKFEKKI